MLTINRSRVGADQIMILTTTTQPTKLSSVGHRWWKLQDLFSILLSETSMNIVNKVIKTRLTQSIKLKPISI